MEEHINTIVSRCMFQLHRLRSMRRSLTDYAAALLVHVFVIFKIDCYNSVLHCVSDWMLHKLQLVQNVAVRLIVNGHRYDHIMPFLRSLH